MKDREPLREELKVPRSKDDDYTAEMAARRRAFVAAQRGARLEHLSGAGFPPAAARGHVENFIGVAQVPIGLAGPIRLEGDHARGDYYVPLATTEGALVASYNRGMRLLTECGGVKTAVVERSMQRAPVFLLKDAHEAIEFGRWIEENFAAIRAIAEATTRVGRLLHIGQYQVGPLRYLRFNYTTGDAAGQNMTGKATKAACEWMKERYPGGAKYILSGNIDTDKKHSHLNMLLTRGRRVTAEAVLRKELLAELLGVEAKELFHNRQIQVTGAFLAGAANNGAQAANGLAALFIATGQDVANVAESQAAVSYAQLLDSGDYYTSITLTSLIVATCGGGTGLPTQRECLEILGCYGEGKADEFAEVCAAVVLAGEVSLAGAILHGDWVSSHERLGRNRP